MNSELRRVEREIAEIVRDHILIFSCCEPQMQYWRWAVRLPNGRRATFSFAPEPYDGWWAFLYRPKFVPAPGIFGNLVALDDCGEKYFEVLSGLKEGENIVGGTYQAIRELKDGANVRAQKEQPKKPGDVAKS